MKRDKVLPATRVPRRPTVPWPWRSFPPSLSSPVPRTLILEPAVGFSRCLLRVPFRHDAPSGRASRGTRPRRRSSKSSTEPCSSRTLRTERTESGGSLSLACLRIKIPGRTASASLPLFLKPLPKSSSSP